MRTASPWRVVRLLSALALFAILASAQAMATLEDYNFQVSTDSRITMTNPSTVISANCDDCTSSGLSIGFTFRFNEVDYTTFSVSSNGAMGLGSTAIPYYYSNTLPSGWGTTQPILMPLWDDNITTGNGVRYETMGTAGTRVLVVDWETIDYATRAASAIYQVRLYEGSNRIEFFYGTSSNGSSWSCDIGLYSSTSDYGTVKVSSGVYSWKTANDTEPAPASGTLYAFYTACIVNVNGNVSQGGTAGMYPGDTLLTNVVVERGNQTTRQPFTTVFNACIGGPMTYFVSGPAAADYTFTPSSTSTSPSTPTVTFRPLGTGDRYATLTLFGGNQYSQVYQLRARATPRLQFVPDLSQGGATPMVDGARLLANVSIPRTATAVRIPFSIQHIGTTGPVSITYTLVNSSNGQYSISTPSASLMPGQSTSQTITFAPHGVGTIWDTLIVNADGDVLRFPLAAFSEGTGAYFSVNGTALDTSSLLFVNQYGCVGDQFFTLPMLVTNVGSLPFRIEGVDGYVTDTTYRQGTPRYPLLRDDRGNLIPAGDYIVTTTPPTSGGSNATYPIVIPVGESVTLYLTFTPTRPGKRFARVYIRTNDEIRMAPDTAGVASQGLVVFDAFGRGSGAMLSDNPNGGLPKSFVFEKTPLGVSRDQWLMIENPGTCELRINEEKLSINTGDIDEFSIVGVSQTWPRDNSGGLSLAPGGRDSVQVRFSPGHIGSRRATLRLETNDSTVLIPGLTERGVYYMDLYGEGKDGLYVHGIEFGMTELNSTSSGRGVTLRNAADVPFIITSASIVGVDALEFSEDASKPWPARPFAIVPGQIMELSVSFAPTGTVSGPRSAELELVTDRDDTVRASLTGDAGLKSVTGPTSINFGTLGVGGETRQTISIANAGTMPARITDPVVSGANAAEYTVNPLTRHMLLVGESEMIEVTWRPNGPGASSAALTIGAEGGDVVVALNGTAAKPRYVGEDPSGTIGSNEGGGLVSPGIQDPAKSSSVDAVTRQSGVALWQSLPNPARDRAEIRYASEHAGMARIDLYDEKGALVGTLVNQAIGVGEHRLVVDLANLSSGTYRYALTIDGITLTRSLTVTR